MNFLSADDLSKEAINKIFDMADSLAVGKQTTEMRQNTFIALYFESPSTRTRLSFDAAITQLNGHSVYLEPQMTERVRGESLADTSRMISSYCDLIAARMHKHTDLLELAGKSSVPVINALTDLEHPTQALADVYTMRQYKKSIRNIKVAFVGDVADNVCNSLIVTAAKLGAEIALVGPKGYPPSTKYVEKAREYSKIFVTNSLEDGLEDADIVYTDTFVSVGQEADAEKRKKLFAPYQVNSKVVEMADKDALVMHCLPAFRGIEITDDVIDGPRSIVWAQAKNKTAINKALLLYILQHQ